MRVKPKEEPQGKEKCEGRGQRRQDGRQEQEGEERELSVVAFEAGAEERERQPGDEEAAAEQKQRVALGPRVGEATVQVEVARAKAAAFVCPPAAAAAVTAAGAVFAASGRSGPDGYDARNARLVELAAASRIFLARRSRAAMAAGHDDATQRYCRVHRVRGHLAAGGRGGVGPEVATDRCLEGGGGPDAATDRGLEDGTKLKADADLLAGERELRKVILKAGRELNKKHAEELRELKLQRYPYWENVGSVPSPVCL